MLTRYLSLLLEGRGYLAEEYERRRECVMKCAMVDAFASLKQIVVRVGGCHLCSQQTQTYKLVDDCSCHSPNTTH